MHKSLIDRKLYLDSLRGFAILMTIVYHLQPQVFLNGFFSVDIFFVLSGYLITEVLSAASAQNQFSIINFYANRIRRLFPSYLVVIASLLLFGYFLMLPSELYDLARYIISSATYTTNFLLMNDVGYFDMASYKKPLLVFWSLSVEEQFYIFYPILLLLVFKMKEYKYRLSFFIFLGIIFLALDFYFNNTQKFENYYAPQYRFWAFLLGAFGSLFLEEFVAKFSQRRKNILSFIALAAIFYSMSGELKSYSMFGRLPVVLGSVFLIVTGQSTLLNQFLAKRKFLILTGLISYPLYLWHWSLLAFYNLIYNDNNKIVQLSLVFISFILSWLMYRYIEVFFKSFQSKKIAPYLLGASVVLAAIAYIIKYEEGLTTRFSGSAYEKFSSVGRWMYSHNENCDEKFNFKNLNDRLKTCYLTQKADPDLILVGDSQASQYYPGLVENLNFKNNNILSIGRCPPILNVENITDQKLLAQYKTCSTEESAHLTHVLNQTVSKLNKREKKIKYVIISFSYTLLSTTLVQYRYTPQPDIKSAELAFMAGFSDEISLLDRLGVQVIFINPQPHLSEENFNDCLSRPLKKIVNLNCQFEQKAFYNDRSTFELIRQLELKNKNFHIFDSRESICRENVCSFNQDQVFLLRDRAHLSELGSAWVIQKFSEWFQTVK